MDNIRLSDGREVSVVSFAISTAGYLFIRVSMSIAEAYTFFSHGTDSIVYKPSEGEARRVLGFTNIAYIVNEENCVRVALVRPAEFWEA
jgi:hypothetical protein